MAISGVGVAMAAAGGFVAYVAITDQPPADALRAILKGQVKNSTKTPTTLDPTTGLVPVASAGDSFGGQVGLADAAVKYVGRKYEWAHNFDPPNGGGDCSGLVYRAFHDLGSNTPRLSSWQYPSWDAVIAGIGVHPGDILWWRGHVAIAVSASTMVEAPTVGVPVRITAIRKGYSVLTPNPTVLNLRYRPASSRGKAF